MTLTEAIAAAKDGSIQVWPSLGIWTPDGKGFEVFKTYTISPAEFAKLKAAYPSKFKQE